jgi:hypothetical protein
MWSHALLAALSALLMFLICRCAQMVGQGSQTLFRNSDFMSPAASDTRILTPAELCSQS